MTHAPLTLVFKLSTLIRLRRRSPLPREAPTPHPRLIPPCGEGHPSVGGSTYNFMSVEMKPPYGPSRC
jgi:hypothetical protein